MNRIFKILFIFLFFILSIGASFAKDNVEEVIFLQNDYTMNLDTSQSANDIYVVSNQNFQTIYSQKDENANSLCSDSNIFESKAGQAFYKFVNNRVVNNKFNLFSVYLGEENKARAP